MYWECGPILNIWGNLHQNKSDQTMASYQNVVRLVTGSHLTAQSQLFRLVNRRLFGFDKIQSIIRRELKAYLVIKMAIFLIP